MNARINVARVVQGMRLKGWGIVSTCAHCRVTGRTLNKILDGHIPKKLDSLYRVFDGLDIPQEEGIINAGAPTPKEGPRLVLVHNRRRTPGDDENEEQEFGPGAA